MNNKRVRYRFIYSSGPNRWEYAPDYYAEQDTGTLSDWMHEIENQESQGNPFYSGFEWEVVPAFENGQRVFILERYDAADWSVPPGIFAGTLVEYIEDRPGQFVIADNENEKTFIFTDNIFYDFELADKELSKEYTKFGENLILEGIRIIKGFRSDE